MKKGAAKQELAAEQVEEVREAFSLFDVDSSGAISYKELRACMKALGIKVDKDELKKMILEVDADQSGEIEFPEFLQMMTGKMASNDTKEETMKVYKMFDTDGSGAVSMSEFVKTLERFGMHVAGQRPGIGGLPMDVVQSLFDKYDKDSSGQIDYKEFTAALFKVCGGACCAVAARSTRPARVPLCATAAKCSTTAARAAACH